jgi:hypothetical protein
MPDEQALAILDQVKEKPSPPVPDIEVVVEEPGTEQTETSTGLARYESVFDPLSPSEELARSRALRALDLAAAVRMTEAEFGPVEHSASRHQRRVITTEDLDSSIQSLVAEWLPATAVRELMMRLLFEDSALDLKLSAKELDDPTITLKDLLSRSTSES